MNRYSIALIAISFVIAMLQGTSVEAKYYGGKECRNDYKRICGSTPRGKCDLATMKDKLSPACRSLIEKG